MSTKNTIFLKQSKPIDFTLWLISFCSWKFLAITTSLAIVGAASEFIYTQFPDNFQTAMIICVMLFYVIIDMGIVPMMKLYWNFKDTTNPHQKKFLNVILFFIILKIVISLTSSIWASPEAAGVITENNKPKAEQKLLSIESSHDDKLLAAKKGYESAEKSLNKDVRNYIYNNGDRYQIKSFNDLGIDGWICHPSNKDLKDIELCTNIRKIQNSLYDLNITYLNLLSDTTHQSLVKNYTNEIITSDAEFKNQMSRRTGYFIYLDIIALIFGIGSEYLRHIRKEATETNTVDTPTLSYIFGAWFESIYNGILYWLEEKLQYDINGDGHQGKPTIAQNFRTQRTPITASIPVSTEQPNTYKKNTPKTEHPTKKEQPNTTEQNTQKPSANKEHSTEQIEVGEVIFLKDERVFEHRTEKGTTYMSETQCKGRLNKANNRLAETMKKINTGTASQQTIRARHNREKNVAYWETAVQKFQTKVSNY